MGKSTYIGVNNMAEDLDLQQEPFDSNAPLISAELNSALIDFKNLSDILELYIERVSDFRPINKREEEIVDKLFRILIPKIVDLVDTFNKEPWGELDLQI